ncbi:hypothetical protein HAHE_28140 [Haloferula helveola]|uniref:Uncharacterized protein n=1 Tax=Haloferula helveola TaxID=490095 RepID=A0ABM7RBG1_9BACT|nr:hypothetical protein HAHE_28140 [Haloferula helveola]
MAELDRLLEELEQTFLSAKVSDGFFVEELNALSSYLYSESEKRQAWDWLHRNLDRVKSPRRREGLCIAVFECAVEDPEAYEWRYMLSKLLKHPSRYWVLVRSYRDTPDLLLRDVQELGTRH